MWRLRSTEGFTLVELMVVVLVIGILVAVAIPVLNVARGTASKAACQNNLRSLDGALVQWWAANSANQPTSINSLAAAEAVLADTTPSADGTTGMYVKKWSESSGCPLGDAGSTGGDCSYTVTAGEFGCPNAAAYGHTY